MTTPTTVKPVFVLGRESVEQLLLTQIWTEREYRKGIDSVATLLNASSHPNADRRAVVSELFRIGRQMAESKAEFRKVLREIFLVASSSGHNAPDPLIAVRVPACDNLSPAVEWRCHVVGLFNASIVADSDQLQELKLLCRDWLEEVGRGCSTTAAIAGLMHLKPELVARRLEAFQSLPKAWLASLQSETLLFRSRFWPAHALGLKWPNR